MNDEIYNIIQQYSSNNDIVKIDKTSTQFNYLMNKIKNVACIKKYTINENSLTVYCIDSYYVILFNDDIIYKT